MRDTIYREDAITKIAEHLGIPAENWMKIAEEWIKDVPSAQPDWIPVTERLPEDKQPVIFSTKTGRVHQGKYYKDGSVNQWYSALDKMRAFNNVVNAWIPLPDPWRGEQDALN